MVFYGKGRIYSMKIKDHFFVILVSTFKIFILYFILTIVLIMIYFIFYGSNSVNPEQSLVLWLGGTITESSIAIGLIRLSFVLIIFIQTSNILESLKSNFSIFLQSRVGNRKKLCRLYYHYIILTSLILLIFFHLLFFIIFWAEYSEILNIIHFKNYLIYALVDIMSLISFVSLFFILDVLFSYEHALLIILLFYVMNFVLPFANIVAVSTSKLGTYGLLSTFSSFSINSVAVSIFIIILTQIIIIRKKEIVLC